MPRKIEYFKVKNLKQTNIRKPKSIDALLDKGYVVSIVETTGNKTKITTHSPRGRQKSLLSRMVGGK